MYTVHAQTTLGLGLYTQRCRTFASALREAQGAFSASYTTGVWIVSPSGEEVWSRFKS